MSKVSPYLGHMMLAHVFADNDLCLVVELRLCHREERFPE